MRVHCIAFSGTQSLLNGQLKSRKNNDIATVIWVYWHQWAVWSKMHSPHKATYVRTYVRTYLVVALEYQNQLNSVCLQRSYGMANNSLDHWFHSQFKREEHISIHNQVPTEMSSSAENQMRVKASLQLVWWRFNSHCNCCNWLLEWIAGMTLETNLTTKIKVVMDWFRVDIPFCLWRYSYISMY